MILFALVDFPCVRRTRPVREGHLVKVVTKGLSVGLPVH